MDTETIFGQGDPQGDSTGNPAWNDFLAFVPEERTAEAQEFLKTVDQRVNERFAARAEEVKPYQEIIKNKVDPEFVNNGVALYKLIQDRPEEVFKMMAEQFGADTVQQILGITPTATPTSEEEGKEDPFAGLGDHPIIKQINEGLQNVATAVLTEKEQQEEQTKMDKIITDTLTLEKPDYLGRELNEFESKYVMSEMLGGANLEDAWNSLKGYLTDIGVIKVTPPAPSFVMGANGGNPQGSVDPRKMTESQRQHAAREMLDAALAAQRQG